MIGLLLPALIAIVSIGIAYFQGVQFEDKGTALLGMAVGLALTYGHRFLRPVGIDFAAVSKYVGWAALLLFSVWLAYPSVLPWANS